MGPCMHPLSKLSRDNGWGIDVLAIQENNQLCPVDLDMTALVRQSRRCDPARIDWQKTPYDPDQSQRLCRQGHTQNRTTNIEIPYRRLRNAVSRSHSELVASRHSNPYNLSLGTPPNRE